MYETMMYGDFFLIKTQKLPRIIYDLWKLNNKNNNYKIYRWKWLSNEKI